MSKLEEIIEEELRNAFNAFSDNYDHETEDNPVPYGDTWVSSGDYITEESMERCVDEFKENFDYEEFVHEQLPESLKFENAVREILERVRL